MPEVLTQVDPGGRVKKPKRKIWTGPIGCLQCDYSTQELHDAGASFEEQEDIISAHLDTHGVWRYESTEQTEQRRLEREVTDAAKRWAESQCEEFSSGIPEMVAEGELLRAIERLTEFESQVISETSR